jgi:phosphatidylinositol glycan class N
MSRTFADILQVQSYYYREVYTVVYLALALWPLSYGPQFIKLNGAMVFTWCIACTTMSVFTLLPARKMESLTLV